MAELWIWADPHLGHDAIRIHCNRPFATCAEMDEAEIGNYRAVVKPKDDVIFLGDWAFRDHDRYLARLPGHKTFIFGNHDKMPLSTLHNFTRVIGAHHCPGILEMHVGIYNMTLSHYPLTSWNGSGHGTWNVHGHCHGRLPEPEDMLRMDVGVDVFDFAPVNFEVVRRKLCDRIPAWEERRRQQALLYAQEKPGDDTAANKAVDMKYLNAWRQDWEHQQIECPLALDYRQRYTSRGKCRVGCQGVKTE